MLDKMKFPVVFKICFKPGIDLEKLQELGYDSVWGYFSGQSRFNNSVFGWEVVCFGVLKVKLVKQIILRMENAAGES